MMPASTTYKFQMIDVVFGKSFKDGMCNKWASWMLEECEKLGLTSAGNYKHPTYPDCLKWVKEVWDDLATDGIVSKAQELGMSADPGPEIPGYVETEFEDVQPNGPMVEYRDSELVEDLTEE